MAHESAQARAVLGRCFCPRGKWWLCDGDCVDCEFHTRNEVSLDDPLPDGEGTRGDYVPDDNPTPEEIISDRDLLERTCLGR